MTAPAKWSRAAYLEERGRELERHEREARTYTRRLLAQTLGGCALCSALGILLVLWSMHTTGDIAMVAFWGGLTVGNTGMMALLLRDFRITTAGEF